MLRKKIFLCGNSAWSMYNFRGGLLKKLIYDGYDISVLSPKDSFSEKLLDIGCKVIDIPLVGNNTNPIKELKLLLLLIRIYRKEKPNLVINYTIKPNIYSTIAAKMAGVPSIAITTGLGFSFTNKSLVSYISKILYKFSLQFSDKVWFLNTDDCQTFIEQKIIKKSKSDILYGEGISLEYFSPQHNLKEKDSPFIFILIARMLKDKGVLEFVEAAKIIKSEYPNVRFQLLGFCDVENPSAISRDQIDLWDSKGIIEYIGVTDDVRPFIARSDCIVLPSYYREGIPRILMEASAMEKPIITSDNVGCREVIIDGITGFMCKKKDIDSLVDTCIHMLNIPTDEYLEMGINGRKFISDKFSEQIVIDKYLKYIECRLEK